MTPGMPLPASTLAGYRLRRRETAAMAEQSAFVTNIMETLTPLGDARLKRMFGGYGIFLDGAMFALVSRHDELFLKADDVNRGAFLERGSGSHGKMPYFAAPAEALDGWSALEPWARGAVAASKRAKRK
jgi:DNA transformation protein